MPEYLTRKRIDITGGITLEVLPDDSTVDVSAEDTTENFVIITTEEELRP